LNKLEPTFRRTVENLITPVVVVLSTKSQAQENLRDMIKKAIGIDLWNR
jgi:vacuolar-type H+-ATPase subunit F/Vma7